MTDAPLARLREADSPHVRALAALIADDLAKTPLRDLVPPAVLAHEGRRWIRVVATAPPSARAAWIARVEAVRRHAQEGPHAQRTLRDAAMPEVEAAARRLLSAPWSPDEALVRQLIDHPATRAMLGEVLTASLHSFLERVRSLDDGVLGGLGGRAVTRGRGLLGGLAQGLSAATEGVVATVREELQRALEGRVQPFVGQASEDAVAGIAAWVADPAHAPALAELRVAVFDALLDMPLADAAGQLDGLDASELIDVLIGVASSLDASAGLDARLQELAELALDVAGGDGTPGAVLASLELEAPWRDALTEALARRLAPLFQRDDFGAWWSALHA